MKVCPQCKTVYDNKFKFCKKCGVPLEVKTVNKKPVRQVQHREESNDYWVWIVVALIVIAVAGIGFYHFNNKIQTLDKKIEIQKKKSKNEIQSLEDKIDNQIKANEEASSVNSYDNDNSFKNFRTSVPVKSYSNITDSAITGAYHSSVDIEGTYAHSADLTIDGNIKSCWSEGVSGWGIGEFITVFFNDTYIVSGLNIWIGHQKTQELFYKNGRPIAIRVEGSDGFSKVFWLRDVMGMQRINFPYPIKTNNIKIIVAEVSPGTTYKDTCIAEVSFF